MTEEQAAELIWEVRIVLGVLILVLLGSMLGVALVIDHTLVTCSKWIADAIRDLKREDEAGIERELFSAVLASSRSAQVEQS